METIEKKPAPPRYTIQPAEERATFDHGWLQTSHSFSFAEYFDPANLSWGALRVFNDDVVAPGTGFGTHPHRDMEILTYVLEGELEHRDSLGNVGVVRAGGVQYLSAGTGLSHSEKNHSEQHPLHFVQMWVMPRAQQLEPRYGQVDFTQADRQNAWLTIASGRENTAAPINIWQDATAYVARLDDGRLEKTIEADRFAFLFVASGNVTFDGKQSLEAGDGIRIDAALRDGLAVSRWRARANSCCGIRPLSKRASPRDERSEVPPSRYDPRRDAECERMRGVLEDGQPLGASADVRGVRPRRVLRFLNQQARDQTLSRNEPPDHHLARTRRALEVLLHR